jgi:hypothetical protein
LTPFELTHPGGAGESRHPGGHVALQCILIELVGLADLDQILVAGHGTLLLLERQFAVWQKRAARATAERGEPPSLMNSSGDSILWTDPRVLYRRVGGMR